MPLNIGIVGLPNVGKSTIFNALTKSQTAQAENYPFCTIDPNVGVVEVPDKRLDELAKKAKPLKVIPTVIEFVDIAGLVEGASKGEGLGNKFLSHIRECDAIAQVIRVFEDSNIVHVHGEINPQKDKEIIEAELIFADLETLQKRLQKAETEARAGDDKKIAYANLLKKIEENFHQGKMVAEMDLEDEDKEQIYDLHFLSAKPFLYILNIKEEELKTLDIKEARAKLCIHENAPLIPICAKVEEELTAFTVEEAQEYLTELGLPEPGLNLVISEAYRILGLETYFTAGEKEVRAWTIKKGMNAKQSAGVIHTDFEKGFIKAEVIWWEDYVEYGELGAREKGKMKLEGKEYIVRDGDVMHFHFNN